VQDHKTSHVHTSKRFNHIVYLFSMSIINLIMLTLFSVINKSKYNKLCMNITIMNDGIIVNNCCT